MRHYIVTYTRRDEPDEKGEPTLQYFRCQADDADHAEEQCFDAAPDPGLVSVFDRFVMVDEDRV